MTAMDWFIYRTLESGLGVPDVRHSRGGHWPGKIRPTTAGRICCAHIHVPGQCAADRRFFALQEVAAAGHVSPLSFRAGRLRRYGRIGITRRLLGILITMGGWTIVTSLGAPPVVLRNRETAGTMPFD